MFSKVLILSVFIFGINLTGVAGKFMCYSCSSYPTDTHNCSDPIGSNVSMRYCIDGTFNLTDDDFLCTKTKFKIDNTTYTARECALKSDDPCATINQTVSTTLQNVTNFWCSTCVSDMCNSADKVTVPLVAMIVTILSVKLM